MVTINTNGVAILTDNMKLEIRGKNAIEANNIHKAFALILLAALVADSI